jgi:hypothetical protein
MFQPALELFTPRYRIKPEYICAVADNIICEQTTTGSNWSSSAAVDHPTFARLRTHLEKKGYLATQRSWSNGDVVLKPFYLNDVLFIEGAKFFCASAMLSHLERSEKVPMKVQEVKEAPYDAELRNWRLVKNYYYDCTVVTGDIYGDSKNRFRDGEQITTSEVKGIEGTRLITRNTVYKLA